MPKDSVYKIVTDQVLRNLKEGTVPWHKPWSVSGVMPTNLVSKKAYRGINPFLLACQGYTSPWWLSFKQVGQKGGKVRKGERGTIIVFWKVGDERIKEDGTKSRPMIIRYYRVWNTEQCDGIEVPVVEANDWQPIERCAEIGNKYLANGPSLVTGGDRACYSPSADEINMPDGKAFKSAEMYYSTLFHEMTHSTGHTSRLKRDGVVEGHRFGDELYSKEELIAEMGASMLSGIAGIEQATLASSSSYIAHWLQVLQGDEKFVVNAAAQAQKAADLIQGIKWGKVETPEEEV